MKTLHQRSLAVLLALVVISATSTATFANHSWNNYHWARTSNPFTLKVGDNVTSIWDGQEGPTDWEFQLTR